MPDLEITKQVEIGYFEEEDLVLKRCVCGKKFEDWDFVLHPYDDTANTCDGCGRMLYFRVDIHVYEIQRP